MKKKYTIGIDARMFSDAFTGIGRYTYELTRRFFEKTEEPIQWVLFMNEPQFSEFNFSHPHVKAVCVDAPHYSLSEQVHFLKILNRENCDLVHYTHFNVPLLYRKPFVVTIHDTTISFYPGKKMNSWWHKIAYNKVIQHAVRNSERILTVSENTQKDVEKLFQISSLKMRTVWNGIGSEFYESSQIRKDAVRQKFHLSSHYLLYTGVWREHKNIVGLLRAFRLILDRARSSDGPHRFRDLDLVITGKEDPNYPEVKRLIKELDLEDRVKLVGLVCFEDLRALYSGADVYIFPSFYEGFGMPPLEAMRCNTPVCASRVSSIPEVCGDAVQYFDPHRVRHMAEKIVEVLVNEKLRQELVLKGKSRVKMFSWDTAADQTLAVYKDVLGLLNN